MFSSLLQVSKVAPLSPSSSTGAAKEDSAADRISRGCAPPSATARELTYVSTAIALLQGLQRSYASSGDDVTSCGDSNSVAHAATAPAVVEVVHGLLLPVLSSPQVGPFVPQLATAIAKLLLLRCQLWSLTLSLLQSAAAAAFTQRNGVLQASLPSGSQTAADQGDSLSRDDIEPMLLSPTTALELLCALLLTAASATLEQSPEAALEQPTAATLKDSSTADASAGPVTSPEQPEDRQPGASDGQTQVVRPCQLCPSGKSISSQVGR